MNPPCPPFECAHMWGPSLVFCLKDSSLHSSLRQPAFDLMQTIIVSDASALITSVLNCHTTSIIDRTTPDEWNDDEEASGLAFASGLEEKEYSCWSEFSEQSKMTSSEYKGWMCIPMLWVDVLVEINPSVFPLSFSKAVFWARSKLTMVEPETSGEMALAVRNWLSSSATEISFSFGWKVPTGADDGGGGRESKNPIEVSTMCFPLVRVFNRLTAHFVVQMAQVELRKQWTWDARMSESLILSLVDPNDNMRQFGKCILEQFSKSRGLASGLKFLCSSRSSLSATFLGLRHALKVAQLDSVLSKFHILQHFFFVLRKLISEGDSTIPDFSEEVPDTSSDCYITKFSSQGGFLKQPLFESQTAQGNVNMSTIDLKSQEKFCHLLSEIAWPSIRKCLVEGKVFMNYSLCQMTCVRLLEILPVTLERLGYPFLVKRSGSSGMVDNVFNLAWLHDLMDWGKSSLKVVIVYWKRTVTSILNFLKRSCNDTSALTVRVIENIISCETFNIDDLAEQVSRLCVSLSKEVSCDVGKATLDQGNLSSDVLSFLRKSPVSKVQPIYVEERNAQMPLSMPMTNRTDKCNVVVLSDDEVEPQISSDDVHLPCGESSPDLLVAKQLVSSVDKSISPADPGENISSTATQKDLLEAIQKRYSADRFDLAVAKRGFDQSNEKPLASLKSRAADEKIKEINSNRNVLDCHFSQSRIDLRKASDESVNLKSVHHISPETSALVLKELVRDSDDDPWDSALNSARHRQTSLAKSSASGSKRQVIQLRSPAENRSAHLHRLGAGAKRFKALRLDDWYRPILEINYFATVGLTSACQDENHTAGRLKEVPVCFKSPEQYLNIFRPLVLEEFKAQLHSSFLEMSSWEEIYYGCLSVISVERVDDFHLVRFAHDDDNSSASRSFFENDLVLLTKEPLESTSHDFHMVGKVERRERDGKRRLSILLIRFYFLNGSSRLNQSRRNLLERSKWHACRIMNITPQLREFQALTAIKDIPMFPVILKPVNNSRCSAAENEFALGKLSQPLQQKLKSSFNDTQLLAISVAIGSCNLNEEFELSLIQGPPGTGKTRTIMAIVSALLASPLQGSNTKDSLNGNSKINNNSRASSRTHVSQSVAIARAWQDAAFARQLSEDTQSNAKSTESSVRRRVLICAQSNAAVDELVSRISNGGLYGSDGKVYKPYLVRVGNPKTIHPNSLPFFIDTLVDHHLAEKQLSDAKNDLGAKSSTALRTNLEKLVDQIRFFEAKRANLRDANSELKNTLEDESQKGVDVKEMTDAELEVKLRKLYEQKKQTYKDLSAVQAREKKSNEETKALRHKLRKSILREAEIVVTTLSGCGGDLYGTCSESISSFKSGNPSEQTLFDAVVIDEAAQALEPATLIPLQLLKSNRTKCIMVGDPKQLPATVLSNVASKYLYQCSMFERLQKAGHPVTMLTKQYRMHPEICRFPSFHFYDSKLLNGDQMSSKSAPFHETMGLGPYVFYDIIDGRELRGKNSGAFSLYNEHEADAVVETLRYFRKRYPSEFIGGQIGIITPYKCQLSLLRSRFSGAFGSSEIANMEFNTVDGFQGREVDILMLSTVRASDSHSTATGIGSSSIGFVSDVRRMNVALTRAKLSLWIFGNAETLEANQNWGALVKNARDRNLLISVKKPYESMFRSPSEGDHPRPLKHVKKIVEGSHPAKGKDRELKAAVERNVKYDGFVAQHKRPVPEDDDRVLLRREELPGSHKRSRDKHEFAVKKDPFIPANGEDEMSKIIRPAKLGEHDTDGEGKGKERSDEKFTLGNTHVCKSKGERENSRSKLCRKGVDDHRKLNMLKGPKKSFEHDRSKKKLEVSTAIVEGSLKEGKAHDGDKAPDKQGSKEGFIAKRKQQREAVDAILYSALIPSKSVGSSKPLPTKRPRSPASSGTAGIEPPKTEKVKQESSTSALHDQTRRHRSRKDKSTNNFR
ncbi:uncharacterized protein LOC119991046 isoform X2 [Tripterygium wilfordii]|nr:uncharacterized protein LOC119991046 isoform X2 [Tripterygium wilfordii]